MVKVVHFAVNSGVNEGHVSYVGNSRKYCGVCWQKVENKYLLFNFKATNSHLKLILVVIGILI